MNRTLAAALLLASSAVVGCGGVPLRDGSGARLAAPSVQQTVMLPTLPDEPGICLLGVEGRYADIEIYSDMLEAGRFRSFRALTIEEPEPDGCDAFVAVNQKGVSNMGESVVEVYSRGGDRLEEYHYGGGPVAGFGYITIARQLKAALQPGRPLRSKVDAAGAGRAAPDADFVRRLAGPRLRSVAYYNAPKPFTVPARKRLVEPRRGATAVAASSPAPAPAASRPSRAAPKTELDELPRAAAPRRAHAVVIGIEGYREKLPAADFASGDARLAAEYFKRVLGVPEENLALLVDDRATKSDFEKHFERWLPNRVEKGDEVFVYFSGHGAPNAKSGDAYLVPYDGDPTYIEQTGYPLKRMYDQLAKLPAKRVLVAMDSCFSGAGGRSVIAKGARPLVSVQDAAVPAKVTVLAASAGDQISNSYQEKGHGLFTYYLLKGLKEKGADFRAVFDYLKPEVSRVARREYNADQDPQWREGR